MKINLMTWNTQLYEFGNKSFDGKTIDEGCEKLEQQSKIILNHLKKENSIVVLQEIPYKSNITWKEHILFCKFKKFFPEDLYDRIYNIYSDNQIKMTVVIAKKGFIEKNNFGVNNNCCVSFNIKEANLELLGVHAHNAFELREWLSEKKHLDRI